MGEKMPQKNEGVKYIIPIFCRAGMAALVVRATDICVSFSAKSMLPTNRNKFLCDVDVMGAGFNGVPVALNIGSKALLMFASGYFL